MTPQEQERKTLETEIQKSFLDLQKKLDELRTEVQQETDETKIQEKNSEIQQMESDLSEMKNLIDKLSSLQDEELQSLKTKLESYGVLKQDVQSEAADLLKERTPTPTTDELLKDSETSSRLLNIISSNPKEFKYLPGDTAEKKLEYIFSKIRNSITLFLKNKLGKSENYDKIISNTIAPALERSLMELLRDQGNEANISMLKGLDKISWDNFNKLVGGVSKFATKATGSYSKFNARINAIDYLSLQNGVLRHPEKSAVLSNPLKFQEYLNNSRFSSSDFSPYTVISKEDRKTLFGLDDSQTFELGISLEDKQNVLSKIGNIQVVNNPKTTALISKMIDKPEQFLQKTAGLQETANHLLDGANAINSVTKIFGVDILGEISKTPEHRNFLYRIIDFVCKLIGISGGLEGIVKRRRLDRLNLSDEKNDNISQIFGEYQEVAGNNENISITDKASCESALAKFNLTDPKNASTTRGDYLRDSIVENVDINLISPSVVQATLGDGYLKKETVQVNGKSQEKTVVDSSKFTDDIKLQLAHQHISQMKEHFVQNYEDLKDFYSNIHSIDDIAICMAASLYADKTDVIEGIKAKVFLPENYGIVPSSSATIENGGGRESLDSAETDDKQKVSEQRIYDKAIEYGVTDNRQIAYILSTVKGESGFKNQKEIGGENKNYGKVDPSTGKAYYGRGFVQLTHKGNYEKFTNIIKESGKDFKDNNGETIKGSEIDLVNNPDLILQSNDLAAFISVYGMKNGTFTGKKLDDFINETKTDFYNARSIINGMSSKPQGYANNALAYQNRLGKESIDRSIESKDLLIGPHLLAKNKDEIGGLGNSIMNGFQGLDSKTYFPKMDGAVGKSTVTHPNRFNSQDDVLAYKNTHTDIKSFMFYFGANTRDNDRTLSDIKQRSEWMQSEGIQPVLCTCIGENKQTRLKELNQKLISLGKEKNWPVLDFAKSYNNGDIALSSDGVHPQSYSPMTEIINGQLAQA